jgi:hypothetical protein
MRDTKFSAKSLGLQEYPLFASECYRSNDLEFQQPVIIKNNSKRKQLIIINQ